MYMKPFIVVVWGYLGYRSDITEPLEFVQDA